MALNFSAFFCLKFKQMKKEFLITKRQLQFLQRLVMVGKKTKDARAWINQAKTLHLIKRDEYFKKHGVFPSSTKDLYTDEEVFKMSNMLALNLAVKDCYSIIDDIVELTMDEEMEIAFMKIHTGAETIDKIIRTSLVNVKLDPDSIELNKEIEETREDLQILLDAYFKAKNKKQFKNLVINLSKEKK